MLNFKEDVNKASRYENTFCKLLQTKYPDAKIVNLPEHDIEYTNNNQVYSIELKSTRNRDTIPIETYKNIDETKPQGILRGWIYTCVCDFIVFIIKSVAGMISEYYIIPFVQLQQAHAMLYNKIYKQKERRNEQTHHGWGTDWDDYTSAFYFMDIKDVQRYTDLKHITLKKPLIIM